MGKHHGVYTCDFCMMYRYIAIGGVGGPNDMIWRMNEYTGKREVIHRRCADKWARYWYSVKNGGENWRFPKKKGKTNLQEIKEFFIGEVRKELEKSDEVGEYGE